MTKIVHIRVIYEYNNISAITSTLLYITIVDWPFLTVTLKTKTRI